MQVLCKQKYMSHGVAHLSDHINQFPMTESLPENGEIVEIAQ